ncbi:hypothetical protein MKW92_017709 [Papaver armeniacum]|nr:hypothetical protein MKW92_017709 [Papaver armeniacum]
MSDRSEPQRLGEPSKEFNRKPSKNRNLRKRKIDVEEEDDSKGSSMTQKPESDQKSDKTNQEPVESRRFYFESSKEIQVQHDSRATATLETETDFSKDARAIHERVLKRAEDELKKKKPSDGKQFYKGIHGYRRGHTAGAHGPLRASAHIRTTMRFDYQPDVCKDYKETGYCGFGDSCKFVHDRGDYKSGWQMEKEWEEAEKIRKRNLALKTDDEDDRERANVSDDDALPSVCSICRQSFVDPVVTKCKHYFCEHCARKHHSKNKKCFVCDIPTLGLFNTAQEIKRKIAPEGK